MKNAPDFPGLYDELGIGWDLGCLMIDTENPAPKLVISEGDEHYSPDPRKRYVRGLQTEWHATVRYGMLPQVKRRHVDRVLEGMKFPEELSVYGFENFASPDPSEPYDCVVALVASNELYAMNTQLGVLPNVNTYAEYRPHITLGYFRSGWYEDNYSSQLEHLLVSKVEAIGFNYGNTLDRPGTD